MPQMGVSVSEGTITKWLKQRRRAVEGDEPLLEISTDKVDTEVPSPGEGVVAQILVPEGETVEVGTVLAVIAPEGAPRRSAGRAHSAGDAARRGRGGRSLLGRRRAAAARPRRRQRGAARSSPDPLLLPHRSSAAGSSCRGNGRTFVSPVVARIASEHGVDPNRFPAPARGGRVTKKDILAYVESGAQRTAGSPGTAPPPTSAGDRAGGRACSRGTSAATDSRSP